MDQKDCLLANSSPLCASKYQGLDVYLRVLEKVLED